ncbi:DUF3995 domain-containing protein [Streptomyces sp. BR123]|jgi:hypothetical protein|uniref:DUF3995 domain-containing protein n=1 Tax=Streptomyces sp. BR123 TaxID=2749828 RepID=UPI0015C4AF37|nr:DUF3995 domain-containing protein [Streptomyces sp. BR123]NXY92979.1 DUF3995 domain-containing protein [Streptomyces sp. BR123]
MPANQNERTEAGVKAAAGVAATGLTAAAALHALWTVDPWPLGSAAEFAETVVGVSEDRLPSVPLTLAVAAALGAAGYLVLSNGGIARTVGPEKLNRAGLWTLAGVLAARGAGGLVTSGLGLGSSTETFRHWDLALYSPLCLTLAGLTAFVARRTGIRGTRRDRSRSRARTGSGATQ